MWKELGWTSFTNILCDTFMNWGERVHERNKIAISQKGQAIQLVLAEAFG